MCIRDRTGTPAPNGLEDLWPQIYLLDRGARLGRTMRSYLDMYFDTPNSWLPYKRELKPGAEEAIYQRISDICVSMRAADHLKMPERVDNVVEISLSSREEKLYRQMERDMLLPYADGDVLALNAASLAGKLLQLANGAVYDEFHNVRVLHDRKLDALEDLIEAANGKPVLVMYNYQHDLTPVSYTHLDVYKRQECDGEEDGGRQRPDPLLLCALQAHQDQRRAHEMCIRDSASGGAEICCSSG